MWHAWGSSVILEDKVGNSVAPPPQIVTWHVMIVRLGTIVDKEIVDDFPQPHPQV